MTTVNEGAIALSLLMTFSLACGGWLLYLLTIGSPG
jgi:hypothetical protein